MFGDEFEEQREGGGRDGCFPERIKFTLKIRFMVPPHCVTPR